MRLTFGSDTCSLLRSLPPAKHRCVCGQPVSSLPRPGALSFLGVQSWTPRCPAISGSFQFTDTPWTGHVQSGICPSAPHSSLFPAGLGWRRRKCLGTRWAAAGPDPAVWPRGAGSLLSPPRSPRARAPDLLSQVGGIDFLVGFVPFFNKTLTGSIPLRPSRFVGSHGGWCVAYSRVQEFLQPVMVPATKPNGKMTTEGTVCLDAYVCVVCVSIARGLCGFCPCSEKLGGGGGVAVIKLIIGNYFVF